MVLTTQAFRQCHLPFPSFPPLSISLYNNQKGLSNLTLDLVAPLLKMFLRIKIYISAPTFKVLWYLISIFVFCSHLPSWSLPGGLSRPEVHQGLSHLQSLCLLFLWPTTLGVRARWDQGPGALLHLLSWCHVAVSSNRECHVRHMLLWASATCCSCALLQNTHKICALHSVVLHGLCIGPWAQESAFTIKSASLVRQTLSSRMLWASGSQPY